MNGRAMAGMGLACGICCAVPMLLITGALSLATAAFAGIASGSVAAVVSTTYVVLRGRAPKPPGIAVFVAFALGAALSGWGLLGLANNADQAGTSALTVGLAALACVTLLRLPADERRPTP